MKRYYMIYKESDNMNLNKEQLLEIATEYRLSDRETEVFIAYVEKRGFTRDDYYVREWATRFAKGTEYVSSDEEGRKILEHLHFVRG